MAPAQWSRQRRDNLSLRKGLGKLHHAVQVLGLEAAPELIGQLLAEPGHPLRAVLGALAAKHISGQPLAHRPVKPGQLGVHRAGQALAAGGDQRAQFGVQAFRRGACLRALPTGSWLGLDGLGLDGLGFDWLRLDSLELVQQEVFQHCIGVFAQRFQQDAQLGHGTA